ncbi:MAG TPA: hypothetical protein VGA34_05180 [Alteraurantiacibacter sp.]|jgi:hypothetical protein
MARAISLARNAKARSADIVSMVIATACALALVAAGPALPF